MASEEDAVSNPASQPNVKAGSTGHGGESSKVPQVTLERPVNEAWNPRPRIHCRVSMIRWSPDLELAVRYFYTLPNTLSSIWSPDLKLPCTCITALTWPEASYIPWPTSLGLSHGGIEQGAMTDKGEMELVSPDNLSYFWWRSWWRLLGPSPTWLLLGHSMQIRMFF